MLKWLYKRILRKLDLNKEELLKLHTSLAPERMSKGPFIQGAKMCPNTTALALKEKAVPFEVNSIRSRFADRGISALELWIFYVVFDFPSRLSKTYFLNSIDTMKQGIKELLEES